MYGSSPAALHSPLFFARMTFTPDRRSSLERTTIPGLSSRGPREPQARNPTALHCMCAETRAQTTAIKWFMRPPTLHGPLLLELDAGPAIPTPAERKSRKCRPASDCVLTFSAREARIRLVWMDASWAINGHLVGAYSGELDSVELWCFPSHCSRARTITQNC